MAGKKALDEKVQLFRQTISNLVADVESQSQNAFELGTAQMAKALAQKEAAERSFYGITHRHRSVDHIILAVDRSLDHWSSRAPRRRHGSHSGE